MTVFRSSSSGSLVGCYSYSRRDWLRDLCVGDNRSSEVDDESGSAFATESLLNRIVSAAFRTGIPKRRAAIATELLAELIF